MKFTNFFKIGLFSLSFLYVGTVNAQELDNGRLKFGIKGGYGLSSITTSSKKNVWNDGENHRNGFYAGVVGEYSLTREKGASIQLEVLYSQQGAKYKNIDPLLGSASYTLEYDYITVPVLAKIYIIDRIALYGGPTVGFNVNDKSVLKVGNLESKITNDINKVDVLATAGIEIDIYNGIFVEGRYNHGLKSVLKHEGNNFNNSNIQIGVGFKF